MSRLRLPRRGLMVRLVGSFLVLSVLMVAAVSVLAYARARSSLQTLDLRPPRCGGRPEVGGDRQLDRRPAPERRVRRAAPRQHRSRAAIRSSSGCRASCCRPTRAAADAAQGARRDPAGAERRREPDRRRRGVPDPRSERQGPAVDDTVARGRLAGARAVLRPGQLRASPPCSRSPTRSSRAIRRSRSRTPLFDQDGQEIGELAANLNLERLDGIVVAVHRARGGRSDVPRRAGQQVRRPAARHRPLRRRRALARDRRAGSRSQSGHALYTDYRGVPVIGAYRWLPEPGAALVAEMSQHSAFAPARTLGLTIGGFGLLVVRAARNRHLRRSRGGSRSRSWRSPRRRPRSRPATSRARRRSRRTTRSACSPRRSTP